MVDVKDSGQERRSHYRMNIQGKDHVTAQLNTPVGAITDIQPINLSPGGLLCRLKASQTQNSKLLSSLDSVTLDFAEKGQVSVQGHIRRLEYTGGDNYYYCAIQFTRLLESTLKTPEGKLDKRLQAKSKSLLLDPVLSLRQTPNYTQMTDSMKAGRIRDAVYAFFNKIVSGLSEHEQWWFYEVLDALKSQEPHFSPGLIAEYIHLFKKGRSTSDYNAFHATAAN